MNSSRSHVIFDWGGTLMCDNPSRADALQAGPEVREIDGASELVQDLAQRFTLSVATNAYVSSETAVRQALERVGLGKYFGPIVCAPCLGMSKSDPAFWTYLLGRFRISASEAVMIGDNFDTDVRVPAGVGIYAIWYNPLANEVRQGPNYSTVHCLRTIRKLL